MCIYIYIYIYIYVCVCFCVCVCVCVTAIGLKCGSCPVSASYTLAFALQLSKKHGKTSVRVAARTTQADTVQYKNNAQYNK
jgi:hypothetical protein